MNSRYVIGPSGNAVNQAEKIDAHDPRNDDFLPEPSPRGFVFELAVTTSAPVWPHAADGVKPVMEAVQAMLEKACGANMEGFQQARIELEEAALQWEKDLFESEREP